MHRAARHTGFSLIELVIVVVIVGVIAAIAAPRMSRGVTGATDSAQQHNQQVLQNAIDLYTIEHEDRPPDTDHIVKQLTGYTDLDGNVSPTATAPYIYGPYIRSIPPATSGPRRGQTRIATEDADGGGWLYDINTHRITENNAP